VGWTFKLYERHHVDVSDLIITPAIVYGWYHLGVWSNFDPLYWFSLAGFAWAVANMYTSARARGHARFPWEPRS
jgi:hypothetical protein